MVSSEGSAVLRHAFASAERAGIYDAVLGVDRSDEYGPRSVEHYRKGLDIGRACKGLGPAER